MEVAQERPETGRVRTERLETGKTVVGVFGTWPCQRNLGNQEVSLGTVGLSSCLKP